MVESELRSQATSVLGAFSMWADSPLKLRSTRRRRALPELGTLGATELSLVTLLRARERTADAAKRTSQTYRWRSERAGRSFPDP
jgi:hypothetical protein